MPNGSLREGTQTTSVALRRSWWCKPLGSKLVREQWDSSGAEEKGRKAKEVRGGKEEGRGGEGANKEVQEAEVPAEIARRTRGGHARECSEGKEWRGEGRDSRDSPCP
eukprot:750997-Hanusia_phi.AAC.3